MRTIRKIISVNFYYTTVFIVLMLMLPDNIQPTWSKVWYPISADIIISLLKTIAKLLWKKIEPYDITKEN